MNAQRRQPLRFADIQMHVLLPPRPVLPVCLSFCPLNIFIGWGLLPLITDQNRLTSAKKQKEILTVLGR
jgi:hypothetical protein